MVLNLDDIRDRREACLQSGGTAALNNNFVLYDGRALITEVERARSDVEAITYAYDSLKSDADAVVGGLTEKIERLRHLLQMFHDPDGCRYPAVECTVCESTAQ